MCKLLVLSNSPNCKDDQFAATENRCKQEIAAFEQLVAAKFFILAFA